jgi:hypothetical protein
MAESIIQKDKTKCFICKENANGDFLAKHHVFGGALRSKSEIYGLTVYIHNNKCHIFGENAVHKNARINRKLQAYVQKKAMEYYGWSQEDFIKLFYKNYI